MAPSVGLLAVNRQINKEATPLLYGGVTFHIETGYAFMRFSSPSDHICMFTHPTEEKLYPSRHLIRSLNFQFLPEILERGPQVSRMRDFWQDENFRTISTRQRAQAIHEYVKTLSETVWEQAGEVIVQMRGLQNLQLDIEKAMCPQGCCRMIGHVIKALKGLKKKEDLVLTVVGDLIDGEDDRIIGGLQYDDLLGSSLDDEDDSEDDSEDEDSSDEDEDEDEDDSEDEDSSDEDEAADEDEGSGGPSTSNVPALSDISGIDSDVADSASDIESASNMESASTISLPLDIIDTTSGPDAEVDDLPQ